MIFRFVFFLAVAVGALGQSPPSGTWTSKNGERFVGELLAVDGLRATFAPPEKPKFVVALKDLKPEDAAAIRSWRSGNFRAPLVDPERIAPWPASASTEPVTVKLVGEEKGTFTYESANFRLVADLKLPDSAVRDMATVFEATRAVLIAIPLGLHAGGERQKYTVLLLGTAEAYAAAGGPAGSGGYYDGRARRMLVLLPNFGIAQQGATIKMDYGGNLFVLKHEVTHQLIARWHTRLPMWFSEGLAEVVASLPYSSGTYSLKNPGQGVRDYILKWHKTKETKVLTLTPATQLMDLEERSWNKALAQQQAYDLYNSAELLTWYFLQQEGGARVAAFLDALRHGREGAEVALLHGQSRGQVAVEVAAVAKRMGLETQ